MDWILYICLMGYLNGLPDGVCRTEQRHRMDSYKACIEVLEHSKIPPNAVAVCKLDKVR